MEGGGEVEERPGQRQLWLRALKASFTAGPSKPRTARLREGPQLVMLGGR